MTSTDAAALLSVGVSTIKRWADEGIVPCVRTAGGHRRFQRSSLVDLLTQTQAEALSEGATGRWVSALLSDGSIHEVVSALHMARHRAGAWWSVAAQLGVVLGALGQRWATGEITILQEHRATERLKRGLTMVMASMSVPQGAPTALLMTAEGEEHTMGLSLVELCAREAGWATRWAGRNTPLTDLARAMAEGEVPTLLAVSASIFSRGAEDLERQCEALEAIAEHHGILLALGGQGPWPESPRYACRFGHFETFVELLARGRITR